MLSFKSLFALVLVAYFVGAHAQVDEDQLEAEIRGNDFESVEEDSSEELTGRKDPSKHRCSCMGSNTCGCCLKPRILTYKFRGCVNITMLSNVEKKVEIMEVKLNFEGSEVAQYNVTIKSVERMCDRFPGKLNFLKICLYNNNTETEDGGLKMCSSIDMIVKDTPAAILRFGCLKFKDNVLSFENAEQVDRDAMVNLKIKNPVAFIKAAMAKKE